MAAEKSRLRSAELPIGPLTAPNDLAEKLLGQKNEASPTHFRLPKNVPHEGRWLVDFRWNSPVEQLVVPLEPTAPSKLAGQLARVTPSLNSRAHQRCWNTMGTESSCQRRCPGLSGSYCIACR